MGGARPKGTTTSEIASPAFDVVVAGLVLLVVWPVLTAVVGHPADDGFAVLFRQQRADQHGATFDGEVPHDAYRRARRRRARRGLRGDRCAYVADNPAKDFVAPHLITVDSSLRFLLYSQLTASRAPGATAWASASRDVRQRAGGRGDPPRPAVVDRQHEPAHRRGVHRGAWVRRLNRIRRSSPAWRGRRERSPS
jgi:hypothetical protein